MKYFLLGALMPVLGGAAFFPSASYAGQSRTKSALSQLGEPGAAIESKARDFQGRASKTPARASKPVELSYEDMTGTMRCVEPFGVGPLNNGRTAVVSTEAAYRELLNHRAPGCGQPAPAVDFSRQTLLGIQTSVGGTFIEKYVRTVLQDSRNKRIVYTVVVLTAEGNYCDQCWEQSLNWIAIPNPPADYAIEIRAEYRR